MKNIIEEKSINDINYELLKKQFPHAISIDEYGKYVIDTQKLQMSLDPSRADIREDGYGLNWVGKKEAYHQAFSKNYKVLKPLKESSKEWDSTENVLIKGDNLDALKILRHSYFEKIKMIYIDPPYNTKNDGFVYNDNFTSSTRQTLEELDYDEKYIDYIENIQGAKTHSGWLSFMYPRLLLARDLLRDDGVIFISIDDNEVAQLKLLCDEVFGEENFVAQIIWEKKYSPQNDAKWLSENHDYILCYAKNKEIYRPILLPRTEKMNARYKNPDNDPRGVWKNSDCLVKTYSKAYDYPLETPSGKIIEPPIGRCWMTSKENFQKLIDDNRIYFGKNGDGVPALKRFLSDVKQGLTPLTIWKYDEVGHNQDAAREILDLFDNKKIFDTPKPIKLLQRIIQISCKEDDIILDFFAGSGTTAHATLEHNKQNNTNLKFILVQLPELIDEKKSKTAYDFVKNTLHVETPTIFDITKERINRAGQKLHIENKNLDIGYRTFEIVQDLKQKIYQKNLEFVTQEDLTYFMEKPDIQTNEEILYNLFVAENLPLSTKYEELIKDKLYLAQNVAFILDDVNSDELVEALKDKKECEYITIYSPNICDDKFSLELESNISKLGISSDKLRFRG